MAILWQPGSCPRDATVTTAVADVRWVRRGRPGRRELTRVAEFALAGVHPALAGFLAAHGRRPAELADTARSACDELPLPGATVRLAGRPHPEVSV